MITSNKNTILQCLQKVICNICNELSNVYYDGVSEAYMQKLICKILCVIKINIMIGF